MLIVYSSKTGNVRRFVDKLSHKTIKVKNDLVIKEPYILITYTFGFGQPPKEVMSFLESNHRYLKGVVASGNRNWGSNFAKAANHISDMYNVPILHKFELSGTKKDLELVELEVGKFDQ